MIIPTCGRPESLRRTLLALNRQQWPDADLEIVVAIDGDRDGSPVEPTPSSSRFHTTLVRLPQNRGAAAARNAGAAAARGAVLIFLDDDIESSPGLVAAHVARHEASDHPAAVVGYLAPDVEDRVDFFAVALRGWWESMFEAMRMPGHRFSYRDVLTGNLSMPAGAFREVGGFDEALACHEDYELGVRLLAAKIDVRFEDLAAGVHHERTLLERALARKREEGVADVQLARRHPHLLPTLPLGWFESHASRRQRWLRELSFRSPRTAASVARALRRGLSFFEAARLRGRWQRALNDLLTYHYWIGVRSVIPGREQVRAFALECGALAGPVARFITVDLATAPIADAMRQVDESRPDGIEVQWSGLAVGKIPAEPGTERLRGIHLQRALVGELAQPLLAVLDRAGIVGVTQEAGAVVTAAVPRTRLVPAPPS